MGKSARRSKPTPKIQPRSSRQRFLIPGLLGVAVVVAVVTWFFILKPGPISVAAQYQGGARLAIENDFIDFGNVRFEKIVTARFRLRNVGDQPLQLAANPPVEAVEGC